MRSGELSIVAGVYCTLMAYTMNSNAWAVAGASLAGFGVILMVDEITTERLKNLRDISTKRKGKKTEVEFKGYIETPLPDYPIPHPRKPDPPRSLVGGDRHLKEQIPPLPIPEPKPKARR